MSKKLKNTEDVRSNAKILLLVGSIAQNTFFQCGLAKRLPYLIVITYQQSSPFFLPFAEYRQKNNTSRESLSLSPLAMQTFFYCNSRPLLKLSLRLRGIAPITLG